MKLLEKNLNASPDKLRSYLELRQFRNDGAISGLILN